MADLRVLPKGEKFNGGGTSYSFRGVDSTINAVGPLLRRYGIVGPVPNVTEVIYETVPVGKDRNPTGFARVKVRYEFYGPQGDVLACSVPGEAMDRGDKAIPKAMSVALRIALLQTLCLPTESEDPDSVSYDRSMIEQARPADEARSELLAMIDQYGWNARLVAERYAKEVGTPIQTETNPQSIREFAAKMAAEE